MDCRLCQEQITNPLSPECLGEAIEQWLAPKAPERVEELNTLTDSFAHTKGVKCIITGNRFCVCTHCYTKEVFNWLGDGVLQIEFLQYFDFISA